MTRPILWRSSGGMVVNLAYVTCAIQRADGTASVVLADGKFPLELTGADAPSFLTALDAASAAPSSEALDKVSVAVESIRAMAMGDDNATYADRLVASALTDIVTVLRTVCP